MRFYMCVILFQGIISVSIQLFAEDGENKVVRNTLQQAGQLVYTDPQKAVFYASSALSDAGNDHNLKTDALITLGRAYNLLGMFDLAFECYYSAHDICPPGDNLKRAYICVRLSDIYRSLKDFGKSIAYLDEAYQIYAEKNDSANLGIYYNAMGLVEINRDNNKAADSLLRIALGIERKLGNPKEIARVLNNLCLYEADIPEQIRMLREAVDINKSLDAQWSLGENYNNMGTLYYYTGDYDKALQYLTIARQYIIKLNAKELLCDNHRYFSWVYEKKGDYHKAYDHLLQLFDLEKNIMSESKLRSIEIGMAAKKIEGQQAQIRLQEQELEIKSLKKNIWMMVTAITIILVILGYLFYRVRLKRKMQLLRTGKRLAIREKQLMELQYRQSETERKNMEAEIERQKKNLTEFAFWIKNRNDMLSKIGNMVKAGNKTDAKAALENVNRFVLQCKSNEYNLFNEEIERIGSDFIERLTLKHPELSKNEKKLATLLRIDLSTKEIALMIGSSGQTVNMARYRLRKHLGLDNDENLGEYMKSI